MIIGTIILKSPQGLSKVMAQIVHDIDDYESALAFFYGIIFQQGVKAESAWQASFKLLDRIGTLKPSKIANYRFDDLLSIISEPPALHRYTKSMTHYIHSAARMLTELYKDDARYLWTTNSIIPVKATSLIKTFTSFKGIGEHKAKIAIYLLTIYGVKIHSDGYTFNMRNECEGLYQLYLIDEPLFSDSKE